MVFNKYNLQYKPIAAYYISIPILQWFYITLFFNHYREIQIANPYMDPDMCVKIKSVLKHLIHVNQTHVGLGPKKHQIVLGVAHVLAQQDTWEIPM